MRRPVLDEKSRTGHYVRADPASEVFLQADSVSTSCALVKHGAILFADVIGKLNAADTLTADYSKNVWQTCIRNRARRPAPGSQAQEEVHSLVAHSTRSDHEIAAWRPNTLTDQATVTGVRVIIPMSVTVAVAAIPIRAGADADART